MKSGIGIFFSLFLSLTVIAQAPQAFNYQGVARDVSGNPIANQFISLQITLLKGTPTGAKVYQERHSVETSQAGIFGVQVGKGAVDFGAFQDIRWGEGDFFLQVGLDAQGGSNYQLLGTSQLLSVPYALYAAESTNSWEKNNSGISYNKGNVGINTNSPLHLLHVQLAEYGNQFGKGISLARNGGFLRLQNGTNLQGDFQPRISGLADSHISPGLTLVGTPSQEGADARGILLRAGEQRRMYQGNLLEVDNYTTTVLVVNTKGWLGIGTTQPKAEVHVQEGDVFIEDINSGVIMRSPNGKCWRYTPDDNGQLMATEIGCPN